ncbi:MAG: phosphoribosylaminoimidazolesuccinocarboxamide synthase [Bacteroidetes bacterium]|nr:phosphoribosylaminoimidazolesuccinocarboxamide synthase [Bacteroidota bacterium]MBU1113873.1 phosphoribosylaminoimidazolesuccinocarboxamide synthase [Bacteroidota bacterium]MBU1798101.1 phosphoribosylaminoimidazolesuccinocarboxamide synthase [Bacteroidota bacterium]
MENVILKTNFEDVKLVNRGKVRDIYEVDGKYLLVSSDRLSAFDVIMNEGIPSKGKILTEISKFWFELLKDDVENHLISTDVDEYPEILKKYKDQLEGRSMLVKKAKLIPIECIVRGYISGSGWNEYKKMGTICGVKLRDGLVESEKLDEPIFTPSTKAEIGLHDENISDEQAISIVGEETFKFIKETSIKIYKKAYDYAYSKGIILADTKMEFGYYDGKIILIDEVLTPDSSRFWPLNDFEKGRAQASFDKQYVRDYLLSVNFNKQPPPPTLPEEVIINTSKKYKQALFELTGQELS